jgi:predicted enzyme related to lactoylglutathione lyase
VKLESHATVLQVPDVQAALVWFHDALGFEVRSWADGSEYGYAERDGVWFHVSRPGSELWSAYLYTDDVDAVHAELVERGTEILQPPTDKGYGVRDVIVRAPGNHVLAIGQLLDR